jgi:hypothetical protein
LVLLYFKNKTILQMKFIVNYLSNNWIKDNIGTIVLVPTVLGGVWQIVELSRMGIPFIRFFSVSQLVSDGLLLIFIITWTYCIWKITTNSLVGQSEEKLKTETADNTRQHVGEDQTEIRDPNESKGVFIKVPDRKYYKKRDGYILATIMLIIITIIFKWVWWPEIVVPLLAKEKLSIMTIIGIVTGVTIFWKCSQYIIEILCEINNIKLNRNNEWVKNILMLIYLFIFMGMIYFFFHFMSLFHTAYFVPESFKNIQYIECKVKKNNTKVKSFNIEYFNDKYIFIRFVDKTNKETFEVFNFDDFLDHDACMKNDDTIVNPEKPISTH